MMMRLNVSALVLALLMAPALGQGISFPPGHADYRDIKSRSPGNTGNGGGIGAVLTTSAKNAGLGVAAVAGKGIDHALGDPISPDTFSSGIFQGYADSNNDRRKLQKFFDLGISNNLADLTGKVTHALGTGVEKTSVDLVAGAATKTWHEHVPKAHFENLLGRRKLQKFFDLGISNNLADLTGKVTHALGTGVEKTSVDLVAGAATKTWHEHVPKAHFENLLGRKLLDGPQ